MAQLSNGWAPHFTGSGTCAMGFRWELRRRLRKCRAADRLYSGNSYANASYALGVARNSVVVGPGGDLYAVYQAWNAAHDARYPLVDQITWVDGWPALPGAPSVKSRPAP